MCPTLSDPMDCSLPGSSIHGILQARVLEWGAIAFSKIHAYMHSYTQSHIYRPSGIHVYIPTHMQPHTYIHTHTNIHMHLELLLLLGSGFLFCLKGPGQWSCGKTPHCALVCLSPHDSIQSKPSWKEYYAEDAINFSLYHIRKSVPKGFPALGDPRLDRQIMRLTTRYLHGKAHSPTVICS